MKIVVNVDDTTMAKEEENEEAVKKENCKSHNLSRFVKCIK